MSISEERREEMKQAIADEDVLLDECVDETGSISPPGMTYGELQSLLDMADERDRYRELLIVAASVLSEDGDTTEADARALYRRIHKALEGKE